MTKIQNFSESRFSLILHHHLILDRTVLMRDMLTRIFIKFQDLIHVFIYVIKELFIGKTCMFYSLGQSADYLSFRQCLPSSDIKVNLYRLVKKSDKICCKRRINRSLSSNRSIRCSQKRCCIIDKRHASAICACNKSCQIGYNSSAYRYYAAIPAIPFGKHFVFYLCLNFPGLTLLTFGKHKHVSLITYFFQSIIYRSCI